MGACFLGRQSDRLWGQLDSLRKKKRFSSSSRSLRSLVRRLLMISAAIRPAWMLSDLREILLGCNRCYLEYLSVLDDHRSGKRALNRLTEDRREADRPVKGLIFFKRSEQQLLRALRRPSAQHPRSTTE